MSDLTYFQELAQFEDALNEASEGIDGPDQPYNWHALRAMRIGEALVAYARSLQDQLEHMTANRDVFAAASEQLVAAGDELAAAIGSGDYAAKDQALVRWLQVKS